jgi:uncharacterized GH25 family protein
MPTHRTTRWPSLPLLAWLALGPAPALAHDFWIEPEVFRTAPGNPVPVTLRVGEDFSGTSQPYVPDWFADFSVSTTAGRKRVTGLVGDDPAATLEAPAPGLHVIGYHSNRSFVDLDAVKFDRYLEQEGLEAVRALRRQRGETGRNGREYYSRCAKSLVQAGAPAAGSGYDRVLGYPLELVPRADPYLLRPGESLPLELRYLGRPLAGVLVVAFTAEQPARRFTARTGRDGRVSVPLDRPGRWLVKAVHMIEVPDTDPKADWESFWASVTFGVTRAAPAPP